MNVTIDPDTWIQYDRGIASWRTVDGELSIVVEEVRDEYLVQLERFVSVDGYEANITTLVIRARNIPEAASHVEQIAAELQDGVNGVTAIGAEEGDVSGETFVHFYCVFEELLPDDVSSENIKFLDDANDDEELIETISAYDVDEDEIEPGNNIRLEIYPVHESEVRMDG